jgi:hypothetical protein
MISEDNYRLKSGRHKKKPIDFYSWLKNQKSLYIYLNKMFYDIHLATNQNLETIKDEWIKFYKANKEMISMDRTSEIFVTGRTRGGRTEKRRLRFCLKYGDYLYSHARLREPVEKW